MIAIVDDDASFCRAIARFVRSLGHEVAAFGSAEEYLASGNTGLTACLITDMQMPGMNGLQLQKRLHDDGHRFPVIFVASNASAGSRAPALAAGALAWLDKPFSEPLLVASLEQALAGR